MAKAPTARGAALALILGVIRDRVSFADQEGSASFLDLGPADRARASRLARATLRQMHRADAALKPFIQRTPSSEILAILRLATVEMLSEGGDPHGVVNEAVTLARAALPKAAAMVNAVLRKVSTAGTEAWDAAPAPRFPNWLRGRLGAAYGNARVARMEAACVATPPIDLTFRVEGAGGVPDGVRLPTGSVRLSEAGQVSALPGFTDGDWWVQDAAAALPAKLLGVKPGQRVLDLCAAPGGKTLQLAAAGAHVTSLDVSEHRMGRLRENLERTGLTSNLVVVDALEWSPEEPFDSILLDAPCSATGTVRRHPDLPFVKDASELKTLVPLQKALVERACGWLRPGGRLVYATCSLFPQEGEAHMEAFESLGLVPVLEGVPDGWDTEWSLGNGQFRITPEMWPERGGLDGFFIALLQKPS